ncbi:MAG: hypothetical protein QW279_04350 [Candidatus Jordarchaeaceae archaeon]
MLFWEKKASLTVFVRDAKWQKIFQNYYGVCREGLGLGRYSRKATFREFPVSWLLVSAHSGFGEHMRQFRVAGLSLHFPIYLLPPQQLAKPDPRPTKSLDRWWGVSKGRWETASLPQSPTAS